ncbi:MAG: outer membrane lipid asymmetry maintenance protein MlaD [Rhodospirillales bacterium]|nr:outer membrane lipid asymmetry maintenance protein MlaD [Rhodospirillales bacterium]MDE0378014.1 outer membrane lipid asymmetry maintenance protein MlaD [Rhodospirillales bacterium]
MSRSLVETLLGAVVLAVAIGFLVFAYNKSGVATAGGYEVSAAFNRVDGISNGSDVRIGGIKIGTVVERTLDTEDFRAVLRMSIDETVELPTDSSAAVMSDGLLGGKFVDLQPGAEETLIKDGGRIAFTQSSLLLEELIGKFAFGTE